METTKILVVGSNGQLGSVLTRVLQLKYGIENVIATDLNPKSDFTGIFEKLDATDFQKLETVVKKHSITQIYHLAAILSAKGEQNPLMTWDINMKTLLNVLEVSKIHHIEKIFYPSSIAVFGEGINQENCLQNSVLIPTTVYGNSKVAGENWIHYYHSKYGLDVRSLRYPGIIGHQSLPGGGTTDYAIDIFYKAVNNESFDCFLDENTVLPMIYMEDAINATLQLMEAPSRDIKIRTSYNLAGMSFSPKELYNQIVKEIPNFKINFVPDYRQNIAKSWPKIINDSEARIDWNWKPQYDLEKMTSDMIIQISKKMFETV
jgi:threonine 3-dehydrogenase